MVHRSNIKKYALISVFDKSNLKFLCNNLIKHNIGFVSTGSTCAKIKDLGFRCQEISKLTKVKEMLDGRIKSLNHKVHASILYKRTSLSHQKSFKKLNFPKIDYVIVNLYPFKKTQDSTLDKNKIIDMIDIGGPAMLRSAAKNFESVTTICSPTDYKKFINNLNINKGITSIKFRKLMASKIFEHTSKYDSLISTWLKEKKLTKKIKLKYGENPDQNSYFQKSKSKTIFDYKIGGKELGYNNILDVNEGLSCINEFKEPTCIIIKHNNPCSVASDININKAFKKAYSSDKKSAFGGVVLVNKKITNDLAKILQKYFFEIIVAPSFDKKSLSTLKLKKQLILIESNKLSKIKNINFRSTVSGTLYQKNNYQRINNKFLKLVSMKQSPKSVIEDLIFAFKVVKHVKSNAIVFVKNKQTIGIGAGQMSRLDATKIALMKLKDSFSKTRFVCASDAFFPFTDSIKLLKRNNCIAIVQPKGSKNDSKIIDYANKNNISLYFSKNRVFKH